MVKRSFSTYAKHSWLYFPETFCIFDMKIVAEFSCKRPPEARAVSYVVVLNMYNIGYDQSLLAWAITSAFYFKLQTWSPFHNSSAFSSLYNIVCGVSRFLVCALCDGPSYPTSGCYRPENNLTNFCPEIVVFRIIIVIFTSYKPGAVEEDTEPYDAAGCTLWQHRFEVFYRLVFSSPFLSP